jgi:hypothetical protein
MDTTTTTTDFVRFPHHPENVPDELKPGEHWVCCDEYKVPLIPIPSGAVFAASSTNPNTWRSYGTALTTWQENEHIAGVGRVIVDSEPYLGVDLDDCLDPSTGQLAPWAAQIVQELDTYVEVSPSLMGLKLWAVAPELKRSYKKPGLEIYPSNRYFTLTGLTLGEPRPVRDVSEAITGIVGREFPRVERHNARYDGPQRMLNLVDLLERAGVEIFCEIHHERTAELAFSIRCPWHGEHTGGDTSGTRVGRYENGALFYHCEHSHCSGRRWPDFRGHCKSIIHLGRPPRGKGGRLR